MDTMQYTNEKYFTRETTPAYAVYLIKQFPLVGDINV